MMKVFILVLIFYGQFCYSEKLVSSYVMTSDTYIMDLVVRCFEKHLFEKTNTVDPITNLPVKQIDVATFTSSFAHPYVGVELRSSENSLHDVTILSCIFDRLDGDVVSITSMNWDYPDSKILEPLPKFIRSERYRIMNGGDENSLGFGIRLNYDVVMQELKKIIGIQAI